MSVLSEFFLKSRSSIAQLECLEISHPDFTQTYYLVRNATNGVTVTHEDDTVHIYQYRPMRITGNGARTDLDHILKIELGDLGEILPQERDAVRAADGMRTKPTVIYRVYASNVLDEVLYGPLTLEVKSFNFVRGSASFEAKAPSLNVNKSGEAYTIPRFPMLRGFL